MKTYSLAALAALTFTLPTFANVSASSVIIKVYGVSISKTADCANPVVIFTSTTGTEVDFVNAPTLGGGNPDDGTYQCVMITMSDRLKAVAATTEAACVAGTEFTVDVCNGSESTDTLLDGVNITTSACSAGEDKTTLYLHTGTTRTGGGGNAFKKPANTADLTRGFKLDGAFVVPGTGTGTFVANFTNQLVPHTGPASCEVQPPLFGFR